MKLTRRGILQSATIAAAAPLCLRSASALDYPSHAVRIIIGFPPGGTADLVSRLIGQRLSERFGQPFVVESRPGASSNVAADYVMHSAPDGYTILMCTSTNTINATLYRNLSFDFPRDAAPVSGMALTPAVMEVNTDFPANTVAEFIAYAKANPGRINMGSPGIGSFHHVAGELFMMMTGVKLTHVPYHGEAPALVDLLANQIQVMFSLLPSSMGYIKGGKLRALGVTTPKRIGELHDIPMVAETVRGYDARSWQALVAPKETPAEIRDLLNREVNAALNDPTIAGRIFALGATPFVGSTVEFGQFIVSETQKWSKVVQAADIKLD